MTVSERECDNKHETLNDWVKALETKVEKVDGKLSWMITLLLSNLVGIIVILVTRKP